jgi:hypothetical protein
VVDDVEEDPTDEVLPTATEAPVDSQEPEEELVDPATEEPTDENSNSTQNTSRDLDPIAFTFYFAPEQEEPTEGGTRGRRRNRDLQSLSIDRTELHQITSVHLLEAFQAELGKDVVVDIQLILTNKQVTIDPDGSSLVTEQASGLIVFANSDAIVRSNTIDLIARQSFQANPLSLYLFRLQIADDPALKRVEQVWLGAATDMPIAVPSPNQQADSSSSGSGWDWSSGPMLAIVASVAAAILAVCVFAYLLVCRNGHGRNKRRRGDYHDDNRHHVHGHDHGQGYDVKTSKTASIPHVVTKNSSSDSDHSPMTYDPHMLSEEVDGNDDHHYHDDDDDDDQDLENQSACTSMYSYAIQDDASLSVAPSLLYSIHEADQHTVMDRNKHNADSEAAPPAGTKKKSGMWSVVETLNLHFRGGDADGDDSLMSASDSIDDYNRVYHAQSSPPRILGGESESESGASNSLVYDDHSMISDLGGGTLRILQMDEEENNNNRKKTPKKSFEDLWSDEKEAPPPSQLATAKKSNKARDAALESTAKKSNTTNGVVDRVPDYQSESGASGKGSKSSKNSEKELPAPASLERSFEAQDNASLLGKLVDLEDDIHQDDASFVSYTSVESGNSYVGSTLLPDDGSNSNSKSRGSFQPAITFKQPPTPAITGEENDHPNVDAPPKSVRKKKSILSDWSTRDSNTSTHSVKTTDSAKLMSLLDRAEKTPSKPTSFEDVWANGAPAEPESPIFEEARLKAAPPPDTSYEEAWLAGSSNINKHGAAITSQSSSSSSKLLGKDHDDDQDHEDTLHSFTDSVTSSLQYQQPQHTTVMHMSRQDSDANTTDNSQSSGIKISSLIHSFDNAWGSDPSKKTQYMLQARQQEEDTSDDECYMEEDNAIQDRSVDYSLDSDINTSLPENAPLDNLLDDSSFPDMEMDEPDIIFGAQDDDDGEDVYYGEGSEPAEYKMDASVQGSEHSDAEATNMTDQLSLLLRDNAERSPNDSAQDLSVVKQDTSAAERDESVVEQETSAAERDESVVEQETSAAERDESVVEQDARTADQNDTHALEQDVDPAEQDVRTADQDASILAQDICTDDQGGTLKQTMISDDKDGVQQETTTVEHDTTAPEQDSGHSSMSSDFDRTSHHEEEKKEDLSVRSVRSEKELSSTPPQEEQPQEEKIIPMDDDELDSILMSGMAQFLDNGQPHASPNDDASVDRSVMSEATFRLGRHMGKF